MSRAFLPMRTYLSKREYIDNSSHAIHSISWLYRFTMCPPSIEYITNTVLTCRDLYGPTYLETETLINTSYLLSISYETPIGFQKLIFETNNRDQYMEYTLRCHH